MNLWQAIEFGRFVMDRRIGETYPMRVGGIIFIFVNVIFFVPVVLFYYHIFKFAVRMEDTMETRKHLMKACNWLIGYTIVIGIVWLISYVSIFSQQ